MGDSDDFSADVVIDTIERIRVDETIADPDACFHNFGDFAQYLEKSKTFAQPTSLSFTHIECIFDAILRHQIFVCSSSSDRLRIVTENVVRLFGDNTDQFTVLTPTDLVQSDEEIDAEIGVSLTVFGTISIRRIKVSVSQS